MLTSNSFHQKKWCIILVPATIWQTLIFYRQRKCWKLCLKISWNHIIQTKMNLFLAGLAIWNHCVAASLHRPPSHRTMMYFSWNWGGVKLELEWTSKVFKWSFAQKVLQLFEILIFTLKIHLNLQYLARNCSSLI